MINRIEGFLKFLVFSVFIGVYAYFLGVGYYKNIEENGCRDVSGIVFDKLGQQKSLRNSSRVYTEFILIIKDQDTGKYFDVTVDPATFSTHDIGDTIYFFKLSKEILGEKYEKKKHLLIFSIILWTLSVFSLILSLVMLTGDCDDY